MKQYKESYSQYQKIVDNRSKPHKLCFQWHADKGHSWPYFEHFYQHEKNTSLINMVKTADAIKKKDRSAAEQSSLL